MATISRNLFWSTLTSALQLYTGSVIFIVLAKLMPIQDFGILSFGAALSALAVVVADFGFSLKIIKDYPQQDLHRSTYLFNSILAKVLVTLLASGIFFIYLWVFYSDIWFKAGMLYLGFSAIAAFTIYLQALLRVKNLFGKYAWSTVIYAISVTVGVFIYWYFQLGLLDLILCLLAAKGVQLIFSFILCRDAFTGYFFRAGMVMELIRNSWTFGAFNILGIFYFMVDTQIISIFLGAKEVALYQAVFRIVLILTLFSDIVSNVLLPYLSFKMSRRENMSTFLSKTFLYLLLIGCSLFLAFTSFRSELLELLYTPEYSSAAVLVLPFSIVLILRTVSTLLGNLLTVSNKQVYRVITVAISLIVSLTLNLALIPKYGILAAAWTSVLVHFVLFGMYYYYSIKEVPALLLHSPVNVLVLIVTAIMYGLINYAIDDSLIIVLGCAISWVLFVWVIMKRDNNLAFLRQLLAEKGVG